MCKAPTDKIKNAKLLLDHFGEWPCFHDSEVISIHLDRGTIDTFDMPTMEVTINLVDWPRFNETKEWVHNPKITLRFKGSSFEYIDGFNYQNVLEEMKITEINQIKDKGGKFEIDLVGSFGCGVRFKCDEIEVLSLEEIQARNDNAQRTAMPK